MTLLGAELTITSGYDFLRSRKCNKSLYPCQNLSIYIRLVGSVKDIVNAYIIKIG